MPLPSPFKKPPAPPTKDQLLTQVEREIKRLREEVAAKIVSVRRQIRTLILANPKGLTAEEVNAKLGAEVAEQLAKEDAMLKGLALEVDPEAFPIDETDPVVPYTMVPPAS